MLSDLRRAADKSTYDAAALRKAAADLLAQQFLFVENARQRRSYRVINAHYDYFNNLFDALGWNLHRDEDFGYVGIVPLDEESFLRLKLDETLVLLLARLLFEEGMENFQAQQGSVWVDGEQLLSRYETLLRRERPKRPRFMEIVHLLARHGVLERSDDDQSDLPRLRILPSIRAVTGEAVLERLDRYVSEQEEDEIE